MPELWIAGGRERDAKARKALIGLMLGFLQKMLNYRGRDGFDGLRTGIVTKQHRDEMVILYNGQREAVVPILQRTAHLKQEIAIVIQYVVTYLGAGKESFGRDRRPVGLQLHDRQMVPDFRCYAGVQRLEIL